MIKHSGILYKVYTVGNKIYYHTKQSICSDLKISDFATFDSQKPFPKEWLNSSGSLDSKLNDKFVEEIVTELYNVLGISFLGIDIVIEDVTGFYYVIDLNYFTLMKKFDKEYLDAMNNFILQKCEQK